jgi:hypothetical protein
MAVDHLQGVDGPRETEMAVDHLQGVDGPRETEMAVSYRQEKKQCLQQ